MKRFEVSGRDDLRLDIALIGTGWKVKHEIPEGAVYLTREQVSEAISLCFEYGNEGICNYLFGMPSVPSGPG